MKFNNIVLFFLIVLSSTLITVLFKHVVLTEDLYYELLSAQLSYERIKELLDFQDKWQWLSYILNPLFYMVKLFLLSLWLLCGAILFNKSLSLKQILKTALVAEFIWFVPTIVTIIWFGVIDTNYSLTDIQNFQPLSLLSLFNASEIEPWLIFALKSINLFEVGYIVVLALALTKISEIDLNEALNFTVPVYGSALITWIVFITFLSINLST